MMKMIRKFLLATLVLGLLAPVIYAETPSWLELSSEPLFGTARNAKPTLTLALSVEFPTVGAQYLSATYDEGAEYIGYFNQNLCYNYDRTQGYFTPDKTASSHKCGGRGFSGNFLNWATGSAIDVLRYSLTGGDRILDTESKTVLQRAVLQQGWYGSNSNFPVKTLTPAQALQAVPDELRRLPNNALHNGTVYIYNCSDRIYFRSATGGSCSDNKDNNQLGRSLSLKVYFFTRVEVCTKASDGSLFDVRTVGGEDYPLCEKYPSGYFKPTGKLQRYNDALRVAAFGYPIHNVQSEYSGVLRAPMKYVGPVTFNADYENVGDNPRKEWDPQTGVFYKNPEKDTQFGISGVINYLNQFGRTGQYGVYKTYDHGNELYYEALRYLQGLKPTAKALEPLRSTSAYDGFPAYKEWTDPHPPVSNLGATGDYSCYRNHILFIGDKNTHYDNQIPGNTGGASANRAANPAANEPDFVYWTRIASGFENNSAMTYQDGAGENRSTRGNPSPYSINLETAWTGSGGKTRFYLAGMGYWANTHDIRGAEWTNRNNASGSGDPRRPGMRARSYFIDVNEGNASATATQRRTNQFVYGAKYGGFDSDVSFGGNPFTSDGVHYANTLWLREPAAALFPKTYFLASEPEAVISAFDTIFASIVSSNYSIAGMAFSNSYTGYVADGDQTYQASFNGSNWSGDITLNDVKVDADDKVTLIRHENWGVAQPLNEKLWSERQIFVGQRLAGDYKAVAFTWDRLSSSQRTAISSGASATVGQQRTDYLRGDRSNESKMRLRSGVLGDIINSGVVYKGAPFNLKYDADYTSFHNALRDRAGVVYAGANDGMLHAFSAESGEELFAYIPSFVVPDLYLLTLPDYKHHSYVDATPVVDEAKVGDEWKTVLVGGAGAGGQGVYALDVTDPTEFGADNLIWEFTDEDDPELGNVMGSPRIVRIATQSAPTMPIEYKWYAIVPGGVNAEVEGNASVTLGINTLFILDLSKPAGQPWRLNSNYYKVVLPGVANQALGIINLSVAVNRNNTLEAIYAGDLSGTLWKVPLGTNQSLWSADSAQLLFMAPRGQSISMPPMVSSDNARTYISFGTGKYLEVADNNPPYKEQAIYTIIDTGEEVDLEMLAQATIGADQQFTAPSFVWGAPSEIQSNPAMRAGWYLNLPDSESRGERIVYNMALKDGILVANSVIPSLGGCDVGSSNRYTMNLRNGSGEYENVPDQMLGGAFIVEGGYRVWVDPGTGTVVGGTGGVAGSGGTKDPVFGGELPIPGSITGILDWRELNNYDQLKSSF